MRLELDLFQTEVGAPLLLALDDIDEDPAQPRREFEEVALQELAQTIAEGGVRQPISVRVHPSDPDRWMLNFGARRLRASRLAGVATIPAFVAPPASDYDQVIENEQREGLRPLELATFVQQRLAAGESQAEVARRLGKSKAFVTMVAALIDPPAWLAEAYRSGKCRGLTELYELRKLHEAHPDFVAGRLIEIAHVNRPALAAIKSELGGPPRTATSPSPLKRACSSEGSDPARVARKVEKRDASALPVESTADTWCTALESLVDQLNASSHPDAKARLASLRNRLVALAKR